MTDAPRPAAIVTGGAVRLGRAITLGLAHAGYDVAIVYNRSAVAAEETAREIRQLGATTETFQLDLSDATAIGPAIETIVGRFPRTRVLVNNASAYSGQRIETTDVALFDQQFAINLRAPFFLSQAFAKCVTEGQIINIVDNKIGFHQFDYAAYLLSKKALAAFTQMAALEFAPRLRINGIAPGVTLPADSRTEEYLEWRREGIPLKRQGAPEHIVHAVRYLLSNDFVTGQILTVDGGENLGDPGRNARVGRS